MATPRRVPKERPGPAGGKRDQNRRERTSALMDAALRLFLERGIEQVTIDEIAREAGMAKGNFYRYFKDKRDLVDALLEPLARQTRGALEVCGKAIDAATTPEQLNAAYAEIAKTLTLAALGRMDVLRLYLQESRGPGGDAREGLRALADELSDASIELTRIAVHHGLLDVPDPRISALAVTGAIEQLALAMMRGRLDAPPVEITQTVIRMVLHGIGTQPGAQ